MKIVFLGSIEFSKVVLEKLNEKSIKYGFQVKAAKNGIYMMPVINGKAIAEEEFEKQWLGGLNIFQHKVILWGNHETGNYTATYGLSQAIQVVGDNRRQLGMKIRFLTEGGLYAEYSYVGTNLDDVNFFNTDNWVCGVDVVDGGEF